MNQAVRDVVRSMDEMYRLGCPDTTTNSILSHISSNINTPMVVFSQRVTYQNVIFQFLSKLTEIEVKTLRSGDLCSSDWLKITKACKKIENIPLLVDSDQLFMDDIQKRISAYKKSFGIKLAIVDLGWLITVNKNWDPKKKLKEWQKLFQDLSLEVGVKVVLVGNLPRE